MDVCNVENQRFSGKLFGFHHRSPCIALSVPMPKTTVCVISFLLMLRTILNCSSAWLIPWPFGKQDLPPGWLSTDVDNIGGSRLPQGQKCKGGQHLATTFSELFQQGSGSTEGQAEMAHRFTCHILPFVSSLPPSFLVPI